MKPVKRIRPIDLNKLSEMLKSLLSDLRVHPLRNHDVRKLIPLPHHDVRLRGLPSGTHLRLAHFSFFRLPYLRSHRSAISGCLACM